MTTKEFGEKYILNQKKKELHIAKKKKPKNSFGAARGSLQIAEAN